MSKHLLIAGHGKTTNGKFDPGATGFITKGEHRYMKEDLFPAMKKYLPDDHNLVFFDDYNVFDRGNIVALANAYNANQVTEFHFDATGSASASGGHVIIHDTLKPDAVDIALRDAIETMTGVRYTFRGEAGFSGRSNLGNLNRSAKAGLTYRLLELGFGTNRKDADVMTKQVDEYAQQLVKALTGSVEKPIIVENKPQTGGTQVKAPKPAAKTISQMADEVIAGQHGNGHDARQKSLGINASEYQKVRDEVNRKSAAPAPVSVPKKSVAQMAQEVIDGKHGNGHDARRKSLGINQTEYNKVRDEVNKRASGVPSKPKKSVSQMATEVLQGKHGNGHDARRKSLGVSMAEYERVRKEVNKRS